MNPIKGIITFLFFVIFAVSAAAQTDPNEKLALEYFNSGEFQKAAGLYEKLYERTPANENFYRNLLVSYKNLQDYKSAEKLAKKQSSRFSKEAHYLVDLGLIYRDQGDEKSTKKAFDQALKELVPLPDKVNRLAGAFSSAKETDYAIEAYNQGETYSGKGTYAFEIADLTIRKGDFTTASSKLVDLLAVNPGALTRVQSMLSRYLEDNSEGPLQIAMKNALLKEVQKGAQGTVYPDLLIWLFVQQKNFDAAIMQAKALDKRLKEQGERLMDLGQICMENGDYERAVRCYEYVVEKGPSKDWYVQARSALVKASRKKLTSSYTYTREDLLKLQGLYESTYSEVSFSDAMAPTVIDYADLEAFYLNNPTKAKTLLENLLREARLSPKMRAEAKLKLADVLIILGDMWEPALLYGQVDKEFKNDLPGQEAKFRGARLAYFRGDFELAQAQMKVLKASTSKLIANDALQLSLIIIDNLGRDSVRVPLQFFAKADLEAYQNNPTKALETLDTLLSFYPTHAIVDEVLFKQAQIYIKLGQFDKALTRLERIYTDFGTEILADDALFLAADLQEKVFARNKEAMDLYEKILTDHNSSLFTAEARKRFRRLRGDKLN
jgi:tetratricopeptide (TPR) repeat protein